MSRSDFIHLRVRSAYSLSEGAVRIPQLIDLCKKHQMPAVAVTDNGNLFGALEFAMAAAKAGIQPIVGAVLPIRRPAAGNGQASVRRPDSLVLLVQNEGGYRNLLRLVSRAFLETEGHEQPQIGLEALDGATEGLLALSGGPGGLLDRRLLENLDAEAGEVLTTLERLFPDRLYMELMRHGLPAEHAVEERLIELAYERDLPLVATNDVHFTDAGMFEAHDALMCIAQGRRLDDENRDHLTPDHRFKSAAEMVEVFSDLPEAIANTVVVARRCAYMPTPRSPILPAFSGESGRSEPEELRAQAAAGLENRLRKHVIPEGTADAEELARPYRERLDYELRVIVEMGFPGYFLIVSDFIRWAKARGIPVGPGRGSGAGSVVAWALEITDLDPLRFNLLFERFLNPERVSMPDFDIDFCQDRRDEVIRYVQEKYGHDRVAQIITFGKLQARAVLRDVGRVLGMPYGQVDRICKLVPNNPANPVSLQQAIDGEPQLQAMRREDESVARLIDIALKLEGLYRHASTHAAGVVIGDRPLDELVPLYRDPRSEMPVTQFNMKFVETAGLVKFDFLGLKTLTVLKHAQELLRARGVEIDLLQLPLDDKATFDLLGSGATAGVFQLEGSGMRDMLKRLRPNRFEDIIAVVALYRPGPMENIPSYINRKHGQEEPDYLYPTLEPILRETYGIIIYQEQVMQIAQELSGYSLGNADLLRRAMGKKIKAEMAAQRERFVEGAVARGVEAQRASDIFDLVDKFAGYGFNKSHAAAYALVAYQTAYVKANYPVEFMAALMTYDMGNTDKLNGLRQELTRLQVKLLPPDVNRSSVTFAVDEDESGAKAIRYALAAIKNVGRQAMAALVDERESNGRFASLSDFVRRLDTRLLNKRQLENLIRAGALDDLHPDRARLFAGAELLMRHAAASASERESAQVNLFGDAATADERIELPMTDQWSEAEKLKQELEAVGLYLSAHPVDAYAQALQRKRATPIAEIAARIGRGGVASLVVGATVVGKQERTSARGSRYAFVQISDSSGMAEVTVFSEILAVCRELLESGRPILMTVEARLDSDSLRLTAQRIEDLDGVAASTSAGLRIFLEDPRPLERVREALARENRGKGKVTLILDLDRRREVEMTLPGGYAISPAVASMLKTINGVIEVSEI